MHEVIEPDPILKKMNVTIQGYHGIYDGLEHDEISTFIVTDENGNDISNKVNIQSGDNKSFSKVKNVKDSKTINYTISYAGYEDVTGQVEVSVLPRDLTITTPDGSKVYDGTALATGGPSIVGLINGETMSAVCTGSQTGVGSSKNTCRVEWNGTAIESNYKVTYNFGTLTVTAAPIPTNPTPPM